MSAVYFLGVKKITSKKNGKDFYPANFLHKNNWGDWFVSTKFCANADVANELLDIPIGSPVICNLGMGGELISCTDHDSVPALPLDDDNDGF